MVIAISARDDVIAFVLGKADSPKAPLLIGSFYPVKSSRTLTAAGQMPLSLGYA